MIKLQVAKLIFEKKNCFPLFEGKLNKLLDQLNISQISGIRPYRISRRAICYLPDTEYEKRPKKAGLSGRISGAFPKIKRKKLIVTGKELPVFIEFMRIEVDFPFPKIFFICDPQELYQQILVQLLFQQLLQVGQIWLRVNKNNIARGNCAHTQRQPQQILAQC
jgi:hypothetical protein